MNTNVLFRTILLLATCSIATSASAQKKPDPTEQAVLLGQFGDWGAYKATPGGKKVCFALSKPTSATTEPAGRPGRDAPTPSSRPARPRR